MEVSEEATGGIHHILPIRLSSPLLSAWLHWGALPGSAQAPDLDLSAVCFDSKARVIEVCFPFFACGLPLLQSSAMHVNLCQVMLPCLSVWLALCHNRAPCNASAPSCPQSGHSIVPSKARYLASITTRRLYHHHEDDTS